MQTSVVIQIEFSVLSSMPRTQTAQPQVVGIIQSNSMTSEQRGLSVAFTDLMFVETQSTSRMMGSQCLPVATDKRKLLSAGILEMVKSIEISTGMVQELLLAKTTWIWMKLSDLVHNLTQDHQLLSQLFLPLGPSNLINQDPISQ